jgi:UDP-2,3-diacylglucosamine pyrophosphatase LpxH
MAQNRELTWRKLDGLWRSDAVIDLPTVGRRYAILSDIHMGDGGKADDFIRNRAALVNALSFYHDKGYTLILLGDIEEFWQFDLPDIVETYESTVYRMIRRYGDERVIRIFGNHDLEWGGLVDPTLNQPPISSFAPEAIHLLDGEGNRMFLLVHGHQGSLESDTYIWFSRFFVRLYATIEPFLKTIGLLRSPSATKSQIARDYERMMYTWAKGNRTILICGHSHRAIFAAKSYAERLQDQIDADQARLQTPDLRDAETRALNDRIRESRIELDEEIEHNRKIEPIDPDGDPLPCYFNTGCGLYTEGMTAIEIDDDTIRLVKWNVEQEAGTPPQVFYSGQISQFVEEIKKES